MQAAMDFKDQLLLHVFFLALSSAFDVGFSYDRPPARKLTRKTGSFLLKNDPDSSSTAPQQVHITQVGEDHMRISWITDSPSPALVRYGTSSRSYTSSANGSTRSYSYVTYESGQIHYVDIGPLNPNTFYYYTCGSSSSSSSSPEFTFKTPPAKFPIKFAVVGDLGQTDWTQSTLDHIVKSDYDMLLLPGDLSYADTDQPLWDSFGQLVQPLASQRPWMVTQGNHEVEKIKSKHKEPFTSYNSRWYMPYEQSGSSSNLYYSFDTSGVHVIMLGSYTDFDHSSDQYNWLQSDLQNVDRIKTPWLIVLIHAPWYNSNEAHQGESESVDMKASMEKLLHKSRVDLVFAGHVHAYERFTRVYKDDAHNCGPVHITIGDGGNHEGLATKYIDPQPKISVFREASFGHGELKVMNETHAFWTWNRNDDNESVVADSFWLNSLAANPSCNNAQM